MTYDYDDENEQPQGINVTRSHGVKPQPNEQGKISLYINHERKRDNSPVLTGNLQLPLDMLQNAIDEAETFEYMGVHYLKLRVSIFPQNLKKKTAKEPDYRGYINRMPDRQIDQDREEVREQFSANRTPINPPRKSYR